MLLREVLELIQGCESYKKGICLKLRNPLEGCKLGVGMETFGKARVTTCFRCIRDMYLLREIEELA